MFRSIQLIAITLVLSIASCFGMASSAAGEELQPKIIGVEPGNTIISLTLNDKITYDYEVYINSNNTFSLPFKSIAGLLEVPCKQNHLTKDITFTLDGGKTGLVSFQQQKIYIGQSVIAFGKNNPEKIVYIKEGLMDSTRDELFVPISVLNRIFNTDFGAAFKSDISDYSVSMTTNKMLKALIAYDENKKNAENLPEKKKEEFSPEQIILPAKKAAVSLDTIELSNDSLYSATRGGEESIQDSPFSNSTQVKFDGTLLGGNYVLTSNSRNTSDDRLFFGGVSADYKKQFEKHSLEVGELAGEPFDDYRIGQGILGVDFNNITDDNAYYRDIKGRVSTGSKVNVYLNDKLYATLPTVIGYYNLNEMPETNEKVYKLRVEEVRESGQTQTIKEKVYPKTDGLLPKGVSKYAVLTGITGYDNRFFNDYTYNQYRSKKYAEGVKYSRGVGDKITLNSAVMMDNIISLPSQADLARNYNIDQNIISLAMGTSRDFNTIYGQTGLFSANYVPFSPLRLDLDLGISHQDSKIKGDNYNIGSLGYLSEVSAKYTKPTYGLHSGFYDYSPNFYLAGSSGLLSASSTINDRLGGKIGGNLTKKFINLDGEYNKYYTNLDKRISGGKFSFDEYNYSVRIPVKYLANVGFYNSYKGGENTTGKITNNTYKFTLDRKLTRRLNLGAMGTYNKLDTEYNAASDAINRGYSSKFWLFSNRIGYDLPKNLGNLNLEHEIVKITAENSNVQQVNGGVIPLTSSDNAYKAIRVGYTFPTFCHISPSFALGYHYTGINRGLDYTIALAYLFKSGRQLELNYQFNRQNGSFIDDFFIPATSRHSFNVNLTDAISLVGDNLKSIGYADRNNGFIKAIAFLDVNKNGIRDKNEPYMPDIAFNFGGSEAAYNTNRKGAYVSEGLPEGFYKVKVDMDKLPGMLSLSPATKGEYLARVDRNRLTKVPFGLISSVGNITGSVKVSDDFGRDIGIKDLVVGVFDEKGEEVTYTALNDDGSFYISGLSPGKYTIGVDNDFINAYSLTYIGDEKLKSIEIPPVYKDFVDIKDVNLIYTKPSVTPL